MTLPRSTLGNTSLGAVGGARGVAAGGLRILVEFLTQYDSAAVQQLQSDLQQLSQEEQAAALRSISAQKAVETAQKRLVATQKTLTAEIAKQQNPAAVRREVKRIQDVGVLSKAGQAELANLRKTLGPHERITGLLTRQAQLKRSIAGLTAIESKREFERLAALEAQQAVQSRLQGFQALRAAVPQRLAGLAIGAVGGVAGGAVVGLGFTALEAGLEAVGEGIQDLIDPARHSREEVLALGEAINQLTEGGDLTRRQAAVQYLKDLGIAADEATVALLENAGAAETESSFLEKRAQLVTASLFPEAAHKKNVEELTDALINESKALGQFPVLITDAETGTQRLADRSYFAALAEKELANAVNAATEAARRGAAERAALEQRNRALEASATLAAFAEQQLADAIRASQQPAIDRLDRQIEGARSAGPSARTLAIEAQIEKIQNAASAGGGNATRNRELANIAEERAIILLRQRLRLMGTAINLEEYEGKFLLAAIDAKIAAINKQAAAQDRLNRLLDLQFRAAQQQKRQVGESIADFTERKAQENRDILTEQRDLEREVVLEGLNELKEKTQDEVALAELAQRKQTAAVKQGTDNRLRQLQKQLEASKAADRAATDAKIKALEKEKEALKNATDRAIEYSTREKNAKIRLAIEAANTVNKLSKLSGEVAGLNAARSFLLALLSSGALSGAAAASTREALNDINNSLRQFSSKLHNVQTGHGVGAGPLEFAQGGIIPLNNASTPFGANVQFGEQGTEYAVILQHSIAKGLKGMNRGVGQVGPFYMETRDPLRDRYMMKKVVVGAIGEVLR